MKIKRAYNYIYIVPSKTIGSYYMSLDTVARQEEVSSPQVVAMLSICLLSEEGNYKKVSSEVFDGIQKEVFKGLSLGYDVQVELKTREVVLIQNAFVQDRKQKEIEAKRSQDSLLEQERRGLGGAVSFVDRVLGRRRR